MGKSHTQSRIVAKGDGHRLVQVARVPLGDADTVGGVFLWQNPEGAPILVTRVLVNVTTPATGAATIDVGTDADGESSSDNLIDGLDVNAAAGLFDNITDGGTNGKSRQLLDKGEFIVASEATGDVSDLEGVAYIEYILA